MIEDSDWTEEDEQLLQEHWRFETFVFELRYDLARLFPPPHA